MAKKSRTPPPPRRVQAPQARTDPTKRQRTILYVLAASGFLMLALVLVGLAFVSRDGDGAATSNGDPRAVLEAAGCTLRSAKGQGRDHTDDLNAKIDYNTFPPTTGRHYEQWAPWGIYDEPLSQVQIVHNLEHGGVAIQYGPGTPSSTRRELEDFYREDPNGLIVGPLPALRDKIALTVWTIDDPENDEQLIGTGRVATCTSFDEEAFRAFLDAYRFRGPESCLEEGQVQCLRPEDLEPGE